MSMQKVAVESVILNAAKSALRAYFEGVNWPLNKALPKGAEFLNGPLGDITRQFRLVKTQVACQLLNYKKEKFMNTQVSILLNPSDLDERIREGMAISTAEFVLSTLTRMCDPDPSLYGSDFSNLCVMMKSLPSCLCLLVGVVSDWIRDMAERFPKTKISAGVPTAQLDFERVKEMKMSAFVADFTKEYKSTGLPPADISRITFGRLGTFLHLALFKAWSDVICDNKKPPIHFPVDCLVGKFALPLIYYVAGWTLFSASKASTVAVDAPSNKTAPSFLIASCKTILAISRRSHLFSLRILLISIPAIVGFIAIFCIVTRFPTHPVLGLIDCLIFSEPHFFCESQKLHRRPG